MVRVAVVGGGGDGFEIAAASFGDMVFGFLEEGDQGSPESLDNGERSDDAEEEEENENSGSIEERRAFWDEQSQLLQTALSRSSSLESRIRQSIKDALRESQSAGVGCICRRPAVGSCRSCLLRHISDGLRNAGHKCSICKSKWRSSPEIPSGEHTYLDVVEYTSSKKGEVRVVIELNFRAEFEMARASEEYSQLTSRLPEVFVGKSERLRTVIKILCSAAKKCMKEKKMHLGPWRKHKYMQAKWLGTFKRSAAELPFPTGHSERLPKPRASMLTFDLLEKLPGIHCTAVEVV